MATKKHIRLQGAAACKREARDKPAPTELAKLASQRILEANCIAQVVGVSLAREESNHENHAHTVIQVMGVIERLLDEALNCTWSLEDRVPS